jgi:hypothetical protein
MPPAGHEALARAAIGPAEGTSLACQCALPLSRQTLTFVADLLRARLKKTGSRRRKLPPGKIALIVLATLRHDRRLAGMAGGNGVSASTISRRTREVIGLLAARAPRLDRAPAKVRKQGGEAGLLDGTLIPARRRSGTANRRNCNGKHKKHGLLFLALTGEAGNLIWISPARRGAASEITAAARAARPARPDPPAHHPLTGDHELRPADPTSPSTPGRPHQPC